MTFLTDLAQFSAGIAGVINSVFTYCRCLSFLLYGGIIKRARKQKMGTLPFLADPGSMDGSVPVRIHVHPHQ